MIDARLSLATASAVLLLLALVLVVAKVMLLHSGRIDDDELFAFSLSSLLSLHLTLLSMRCFPCRRASVESIQYNPSPLYSPPPSPPLLPPPPSSPASFKFPTSNWTTATLSLLPPELKLLIVAEVVGTIEQEERKRQGGVRPDVAFVSLRLDGEQQPTALGSLSLVSREWNRLCVGDLWRVRLAFFGEEAVLIRFPLQHVDLVKHSGESLLFFLRHLLPLHLSSIRSLQLGSVEAGNGALSSKNTESLSVAATFKRNLDLRRATKKWDDSAFSHLPLLEDVRDVLLTAVVRACEETLEGLSIVGFHGADERLLRIRASVPHLIECSSLATLHFSINASSEEQCRSFGRLLAIQHRPLRLLSLRFHDTHDWDLRQLRHVVRALAKTEQLVNLSLDVAPACLLRALHFTSPIVELYLGLADSVSPEDLLDLFASASTITHLYLTAPSHSLFSFLPSPTPPISFPSLSHLSLDTQYSIFLKPAFFHLPALRSLTLDHLDPSALYRLITFLPSSSTLRRITVTNSQELDIGTRWSQARAVQFELNVLVELCDKRAVEIEMPMPVFRIV